MRVLILSTAFSGIAQRLLCELRLLGHDIDQHYDLEEDSLRHQVARFNPDVIVCPFLTQKIPQDIYRDYICLIVHPGIVGDRGASSLDWAIEQKRERWGVTLIQADEEMDAGDIWGTQSFVMRDASKTSIYKRDVIPTAIGLITSVLANFEQAKQAAFPLDYSSVAVMGRLRPTMKQKHREIFWQHDTSEHVVRKLRAADSRPGVRDEVNGFQVHLYGGRVEYNLRGKPGEFIAVKQGMVCRGTKDGAVWIRQMKCLDHEQLPMIKLPASIVVGKVLSKRQVKSLKTITDSKHHEVDDIYVENDGNIAYLSFDFYNGAMNTEQCMALRARLIEIKQTPVNTIVFMGGEDFFSNGIHLNCIEASEDPAAESWRNINAMNDLVLEIINSPKHMTVAALRNNAGAGGAILALACDEVIARGGVVLNPHYRSMGLYGSEYWTHLLPSRVGSELAESITSYCQPIVASEAQAIGLVDRVLEEDWDTYHHSLAEHCRRVTGNEEFDDFMAMKQSEIRHLLEAGVLARCRKHELAKMKATFDDPKSDYHQCRRDFVYKARKRDQEKASKSANTITSRIKELLFQRVV